MNKNLIITLSILLLVVIAAGVFIIVRNDENNETKTIESSSNESTQLETPKSSDDTNSSTSDTDNGNTVPSKTVAPVNTSSEKPVVNTGFGHSLNNPLPLTQLTSTTCSTLPKTNCHILFKSSNGDQVKLNEIQTNSQGYASWEWYGEDIGVGDWEVNAVSNGSFSDTEVIYVR